MWICSHCKENFNLFTISKKANHIRWCKSNPKRSEYENTLANSRSLITQKSNKKRNSSISNAHKKGAYSNAPQKRLQTRIERGNLFHTEETKQLIRNKALASPHRRLKKGTVEYNGILLDSSWELELAKRLDYLKIKWVRPDPIHWIDNEGIAHNYFPDFYLEDYDLFIDPKNPQAIKVQQKKLDILLKQNKNIIILKSLEECKNFNV